MAVQKRLEEAVHHVAPNASFDFRVEEGVVSGFVVAPEFEELTHLERQRTVWAQIRKELPDEESKVGTILLYSPEEADAVLADDE